MPVTLKDLQEAYSSPEENEKQEKKAFQKLIESIETTWKPLHPAMSASEEKAAIEKLGKADASDIKTISALQLELSAAYYRNPHRQSKISFLLAWIAAMVCLALLIVAVVVFVFQKPAEIGHISIIGSAISGAFIYIFSDMYKHASNQALAYKPQIDKIQRIIIANTVCETLDEEKKQEMRVKIIECLLDF